MKQVKTIIAIPAKDEAERLAACLHALAEQQAGTQPFSPDRFGVLVFANNCSDRTADVARAAALQFPTELHVVESCMPRSLAHAGGARRAAMDLAAAWLADEGQTDGLILTTDADSRAATDWLHANLGAFAEGADVVLGRISLDEEGAKLPPLLHARGKLEAVYEDLLTEVAAHLDPQPFNPWPHHATISGATFGVRCDLYLRAGGIPAVPLGEDKAFVAALRRLDARIRFAPDVHVVTSGRVVGRAPGGVADTLKLRSDNPDALCDEALESCLVALTRTLWRGRLRRAGFHAEGRWRETLGLEDGAARRIASAPTFGSAWEIVEEFSPRLRRQRLIPADLPHHIELASRLLRRLQERLTLGENIDPVFGPADSFDHLGEGMRAGDEELGGLVAG